MTIEDLRLKKMRLGIFQEARQKRGGWRVSEKVICPFGQDNAGICWDKSIAEKGYM